MAPWAIRCVRWWLAAATRPLRRTGPAVPAGAAGPDAGSKGRDTRDRYFTVWTNVFERGRAARPVRRPSFTAARAASAPPLSSWRWRVEHGCWRRLGRMRSARACVAPWRRARHQLPYDRLRAGSARPDRRRGVNLVLDIMGGWDVARNLVALAMDGRLAEIGLMAGEPAARVDLRRMIGRRLTITGSRCGHVRSRRRAGLPRRSCARCGRWSRRGGCCRASRRRFRWPTRRRRIA